MSALPPAASSSAGWKTKRTLPASPVGKGLQHARGAQQDGHVPVVAAGVRTAGALGAPRGARALLDGKRVDVRTQQDARTVGGAAQEADGVGLQERREDLEGAAGRGTPGSPRRSPSPGSGSPGCDGESGASRRSREECRRRAAAIPRAGPCLRQMSSERRAGTHWAGSGSMNAEEREASYILGGNFSGSITNQTFPTFCPVTSPCILSFTQ